MERQTIIKTPDELFHEKGQELSTHIATETKKGVEVFNAVADVANVIQGNVKEMATTTKKALMMLSLVQVVNTKEEAEYAAKILANARGSFSKAETLRKAITTHFDEAKKKLMTYEDSISTDAKKPSEYNRVNGLLNQWNTAQHAIAEKAKKEAQDKQRKQEEVVRLNGAFKELFHENTTRLLKALSESLSKFTSTMTLANWDEKLPLLNAKPAIQAAAFESWFNQVQYNKAILTEAEWADYLAKVKEEYTYDKINALYQELAEPFVKEAKEKLPQHKQCLVDIENMRKGSEADAAQAELELKAKQDEQLKAQQDALQAASDELKDEVRDEVALGKLDATFETQVALQEVSVGKGTKVKRKAIITAEPENIAQVLAEVMFHVINHPKFGGIYKTNKEGMQEFGTGGVPIYKPFADTLLTFFAENCAEKVAGITFKEVVETSIRSKKD